MGATITNPFYLACLIILSLMQVPTIASEKHSYVVYLGAHSHGPEVSSADLDRVTELHYDFLGTFLGRLKKAIFYSYTRNINGFAAILEEEEAAEIAKHPDVVSVFLNKARKLHTTRSWDFLGLEHNGVVHPSSIWRKARFGEDVIIANLDTGVWPESKSFSDQGFGPIPSKWKGLCVNGADKSFHCNRKLIGARYFNKGFASVVGPLNSTFQSPRDVDGHGTHTLSTAAGNFVPGANVLGYANGTSKGGSPKARVVAYKICWLYKGEGQCYDADILAAFEAAIFDGVDVVSASIGGDSADPFFHDGTAIGSFHAVKHGIPVVLSAGNAGPLAGTVTNVAPWQFTIGASTIDREFPTYVALGNKMHFKGQSLSKALRIKFYPLISSKGAKAANATLQDAELCKSGALDPAKVKGKIIFCLRGDNARVDKGRQALLAGAVAMILGNNEASGDEIIADPHVLPASHITYSEGLAVFRYINTTKSPFAYLTPPTTQLGVKPAPVMAAFSSQGPSSILPEILKPDITAPGLSILAAYSGAVSPTNDDHDKRRIPFNIVSGTSMSCPHVAGIVGLLKAIYPKWSPAAIRSAIMTTARMRDNIVQPIKTSDGLKASPFSYGAGHVRPNRAVDPGLVYDLSVKDYLNFLCGLEYNSTQLKIFAGEPYTCPKHVTLTDLNYPSISVPNLNTTITVTRTLKNVGSPAAYRARVTAPAGIVAIVEPRYLKFDKVGDEKSFNLTLKLNRKSAARDEAFGAARGYVFGQLTWSDGQHYVRSPIVVKAAD
ncbi:subtilisin-like protease SBT5.3 [Apium graveolens]|uniref:subtilisin-like protease SBT5.3 n=1 Tax=Apium graveolens TaxID=4045 RepID=UPI003D7A598F